MDFTPTVPGDSLHTGPGCTVLDKLTISEQDTEGMLLFLNTSKASGPDGIPTSILKEYAGLVCCILNSSLWGGCIPETWKARERVPAWSQRSLYRHSLRRTYDQYHWMLFCVNFSNDSWQSGSWSICRANLIRTSLDRSEGAQPLMPSSSWFTSDKRHWKNRVSGSMHLQSKIT